MMDFWENAAPLRTRGGAIIASGIFFGLLGPLVHPFHLYLIVGTLFGYLIGFAPAVVAGLIFGLLYRPDWRTSSLKRALFGMICGLFGCIFWGYIIYKFDVPHVMFDRSSFEGALDSFQFLAFFGVFGGVVCGYFFPRRISEKLSAWEKTDAV